MNSEQSDSRSAVCPLCGRTVVTNNQDRLALHQAVRGLSGAAFRACAGSRRTFASIERSYRS